MGPRQTGHIARLEFQRRLENDAAAREEFERQVREEKERRRALREVFSVEAYWILNKFIIHIYIKTLFGWF